MSQENNQVKPKSKTIEKLKNFGYCFAFIIFVIACIMGSKDEDKDKPKTETTQSNKLSDRASIVEKTDDMLHVEYKYSNMGSYIADLNTFICMHVFGYIPKDTTQKILKVSVLADITRTDEYGRSQNENNVKSMIAYWNMDDIGKFECWYDPDIFSKVITNPDLQKEQIIADTWLYWAIKKECEKPSRTKQRSICNKMVVKNPYSF